jgi:hypothetical protein
MKAPTVHKAAEDHSAQAVVVLTVAAKDVAAMTVNVVQTAVALSVADSVAEDKLHN